ncbi:hypothetical protein FE257_001713 [Aspergillus nanangensis]|uniref:SnoaL-like domain-containing protein n=1 Tax=Aspergillus nanangensis TaxID=2582783 RepID=A0AAD4CDM2_ASPNN|nr:hypothetical protein FE257_001713 [Aspergillus nanangensis]
MSSNEICNDLQIQSLVVRERYYRDTCQWAKLRNCYHADSSKTRIQITWYQGDIDGFVTGSERMSAGGTAAVHTIYPVEIHVNGNKAFTESTGSISIRFQHEGCTYDCVSFTRFISRLEAVNGEWKLLTLDAIYDRDSIVPVVPNAPVEFHIPHDARQSYKCISWLLSQKGFDIRQDLPGTDDTTACQKLLEGSLEWLQKMD